MGGGCAEADVIAGCDEAGEGEEVASAEGVRPLLGRYKKIGSPGRPFEPALAAQRFDNMVCRFGTCSEQFDDFPSRRSRRPRSLRASTTRLS